MSNKSSVPGLKWRVVASLVVLTLWILFAWIYNGLQGPLEASFTAGQLEDSTVGYAASKALSDGLLFTIVRYSMMVLILVLWLSYVLSSYLHNKTGKSGNGTTSAMTALTAFVGLGGIGCMGPAKVEKFVEIQPNETAYVIPLEGASNASQAKFDSVDFLEAKKIATKRVSLPQRERSTGRFSWEYDWIPTAMVIKVDRAPVTREWTQSAVTGSTANDQSFHMQSLDSIPFHIGATITISVAEDDSSNFLYHYRGDNLAHVCDTNVRSFMLGELSGMFAQVDLATGMIQKKAYFDKAFDDGKTYFSKQGITINYFGISGGLGYDNKAVQDSLDKKFIAENDKQVAQNEQNAQGIRNATAVAKAIADAQAAEKFSQSKEALTVKTEMEAVLLRAQALMEAAKKWDGKLPSNVVPQGSSLLFGLGDAVAAPR
ncbi:hypothetical protein HYV69_01945 [Candidatus Uhrbacteria bacterium]|nr:hypothetical protein [Candidatus Uhrbacteria bacterium]